MEETPPTPAPESPTPSPMPQTRPIHLLGSPSLRGAAQTVSEITDDIRALSDIMVHTMRHADGVGLAANQIGIPLRIIVMEDRPNKQIVRLANPVEISRSGEFHIDEGCLSQPGLSVPMTRPNVLTVDGIDIVTGEVIRIEGTGFEAAILAHELDHLNGTLLVDYLSPLKRDIYKRKIGKVIKRHEGRARHKRRR